jgi:hypothetical protein
MSEFKSVSLVHGDLLAHTQTGERGEDEHRDASPIAHEVKLA